MFGRWYSKEHIWVEIIEESEVKIGLTEFARNRLGDVVFVELPQPGVRVVSGQSIGTVESEKTVTDVYSPISGKVMEVNRLLVNEPNNINTDPYDRGWIAVIQFTDREQLHLLLTAEQYLNLIKKAYPKGDC